jgi:hypothetical protein
MALEHASITSGSGASEAVIASSPDIERKSGGRPFRICWISSRRFAKSRIDTLAEA